MSLQVFLPLINTEEIYWQQLIVIPMCFSDCLKCCLCTSIIKSSLFVLLLCHQIQNLVTDTDEWSPCLPGHSLTALILLHFFLTDWGGKKMASALENSSILFSVHRLAHNIIEHCSLFLLLCQTLFYTFVELSSQPRKWQVNFTFQLSSILVVWEGDEEAMSKDTQ